MANRDELQKKLKAIRTQEDAAFLNRAIAANNKRVGQDQSAPAPASASEADRYIDIVTGTNQRQREQAVQNQRGRQTEATRAANRFYRQASQQTAGQTPQQESTASDYVSQVLGISQNTLKQAVTEDFAQSDKTFDAYNRDFQNYLGGRAPSSGGSLADQFASLRQQYKDKYHIDYTEWDGGSPTENGLVSAASYPDVESMQAAKREQQETTDALKQMAQRVSSLSQPDETDTFPLSIPNLLHSTTATKMFKALYPQEYADFISGNTTKDTEPYIVKLLAKAFGTDTEQADTGTYKELLYQMMQGEQYSAVAKNADFAEKSRYKSTVDPNGGSFNFWSGQTVYGESDTLYEYINGNETIRGQVDAQDIRNNATIAGVDHVYLTFMNARQVGIYNYLYATKGKEEAEKYIEYIAPSLKAMYMQERQKNAAAAAAEHPVGASVASVVLSPMKGLSLAGQLTDYAVDGKVDPNEGYNWSTQLPATYRTEVSRIAEDKWGKKGSFLYQTGMSIADNLFQIAITGGAEASVLAIMGTGAAADGVLAAKERGLTDDQAMALGVIAGAAEVVTEKVSLDALLGKISFGKSAVARLLTNVVAEGSEEGASDLINLVADVLVSKEQSEWNKGIEAYKMQGYSERDAFWAVFAEQAAQTGLSILGGAISGGVLGAGSIALRAVTGANQAEQAAAQIGEEAYRNVGQYELIRRGLALGRDSQDGRQTTAFRLAAQYNKSGKTLDKVELGELYAAVLDAEQNLREDATENESETGTMQASSAQNEVRYGSEPVDLAMEQIRDSGTISNRTADIVVKEQDAEKKRAAIRTLEEKTGATITGATASEQRAAVKDALMKLYQQERSADTEEADAVEVVESNQVESLPTAIDADQATNPAETKMLNAPDAANTQEQAQETAQAASAVDTSTIENRHLRNIMDSVLRRGSVSEAAVSAVMKYKDAAQALESMTGKQISGKGRKAQAASVRALLSDAVKLLRSDATYSVANGEAVANGVLAARYASVAGTDSGLVFDDYVSRSMDTTTADRVNRIAKALGVRVRFVDSVRGGTANAQISGSDIMVEKNNPNPVMFLLGHEWTHRMQELAPDQYRAFRDFVAADVQGEARVLLDQYRRAGENIDYEDALDEAAANYAGRMIEDGKVLDDFIEKHRYDRTLLEKVRDAIRALISKLTGEERLKAQTAEGKLTAALEASAKQAMELDANKNTAHADGVQRFSIKRTSQMTLAEQLKMFYDGKMASSDAFYFGETPEVLEKSGFDALPLAMTIWNFRKSTQIKHNIPRRVLKNLMNNLASPLFSFGSGDRAGIILDDIDGDGHRLLAALERGTNMDRKPVNVINSLYGLEHPAEWIKNQIDSGNEFVLYDEKRANAFLQTYGYLASVGDGIRSMDGIVTQNEPESKGKFSLKEDSQGRTLTEQQREYFRDSKAVDGSGRLLTLYHQTDGLFTVFDPRHQGAGSRDNSTPFGIFLKTSDRDIGLKGKFQMELYANITNPLYASNREALNYSLLKLSDEYATIKAEIDALDVTYHEKFEQAKQELRDFMTEWRNKNPGASRRALYDVPEFNALYEAEDAVVEEWTQKADQLSTQAKNAITAALRNAGYDGVILSTDAGSFGRSTDAYIALDTEQVKNVTNKNPTSDPDIRYSLKPVPPVRPKSKDWRPGATFDEVKAAHPTLFALDADEADTRNPTQISGTVKSYRKIYDALKAEGFDGTILDASSGLGYGTRAGREEYGFQVDDIEPFPDEKYKPMFTDYSTLEKTYDVIINNAVLNVMPQDLRDALVVKMGEMLKPGGRAFINVRGTDVKNASSKVAINDDLMEYFISNTGSYQKGFTQRELVAYLKDALGDGFSVEPTKKFGGVSTIVTRNLASYSIKGSETARETAKLREADREKVRKMLDESIKVYGVIPEGENPVRAADIPAKMTKNSYVSEAARTVYEAGATPDGRIFTIDQILTEGKLQYVPEPLERYKNEAVGIITQKGWQVAVSDFHAAVLAGQSNARTVALGAVLLNNAGNSGMSGEAYIQVLQDYVQICHDTGAALAANRILKTLTPEARLYGIQNAVNELNDRFETAKRVAEGENIEIDPDLMDRFLHADDDAMRDEILDEIYQNIADQIPPNLMDMFDALRYLNMLGNFKTMGRNVIGNISMWGIKAVKNKVKTGLERMVKLANPDYQKTTAAVFSPEMRKAAMADFENVRDIAMGEPKYSTVRKGVMKEIDDRRTVFKWEVKGHNVLWGFEKARNAVDYGLNNRWFGDEGFIRFNYANELAGYLTANGVSAQNLKDGNVDADLLNAARNYAIKEAQKATFHDDNQVSKLVSGIGTKHTDSKIGRLFNRVVTGVMPFRKTPANVLVRAIEYSPAGFVMAVHDAVQMRKGAEVTGADIIDHIASAVTGSALMAIGFVLARAGIAVGSGDDDEEQAAFDKLIGHQTYAIEVGGKSFTIDWLTPTSMPFFVGVEAFRTWEERGDLEPDDVIQALLSIGNPLLEMSMMSGVSNLLDDLSYSDNRLVTLTLDALFGYYEQGIGSTLVGQINRSMYKNRKTTMVQDETWAEHLLPDGLQYELASLESRTLVGTIDYLLRKKTYAQIDYVDAWGSIDEYNTAWQVPQQFLLPGYGATLSTDEVNDALQKLYDEMQAEGIEGTPFPERPQKTISWTTEDSETGASVSHEVELTGAQYVLLATAAGQMKHQIVSELLSNETWAKMTTEQKLDAITTAYGYATDTAKQLVSDYVPQSGVNTDIADAEAAGVSASTFISFKELEDELKPDTDADGNDIDGSQRLKQLAFLNSMNIPDSEKLCLYIYDIASNARVEKVQTLMQDANLSWRQVSDVLTEFDTLTGQDLRPVDRATAFAKWSDEHFEDKQSDVVKQVMRFTQVMYVDAATYEKYAAAGLAPQDAANVQDALINLTPEEGKENVTKRQRTDAILKLGMSDEDTANAISALEGEEDGPMRRVIDSGVKDDTVVKVARALNDLKPDADHEQVTIGQKFLAVANLGISESEKMKAITAIDSGTKAASLKIGIADDYGVLVSDYVNFMYKNRYRYDADGNGNFTQAEATAAVNSMSGYGTAAKAALWQLICTGAKGKSNPFSVDVGNAVRRAMGKEE